MNTQSSHALLTELLDACSDISVNCRGTTNHCPMALTALARMGASAERLRAFHDQWERRYALPAVRDNLAIRREQWRQQLGQVDRHRALQACFQSWMSERGVDAVLEDVLSQMPFAPASAAFHALIRLSYGLESGHTGEAAAGLAHLVTANLCIDAPQQGRRIVQSVQEGLATLSTAMAGRHYAGTSITARIRQVATDPHFIDALPAMPADGAVLDELAAFAIAAYWQTSDFTVLHMVTATYAGRVLSAHLSRELWQSLLPQFWDAVCAAYVAAGAPAVACLNRPDMATTGARQAPWAPLLRAAIASDDDHHIKLTYTCYQEDQRCPSPVYAASIGRLLFSTSA